MSTSRRDFLKKGSMVALVAGMPLSLAGRVLGNAPFVSSEGLGLSKAAFKAHLNSEFVVTEGTEKRRVKLVAVEDLAYARKFGNGKEGFSLMFRGDQTSLLTQNTYLIEHSRLGAFSFLLVPMRNTKGMPHYEAVINHLHP